MRSLFSLLLGGAASSFVACTALTGLDALLVVDDDVSGSGRKGRTGDASSSTGDSAAKRDGGGEVDEEGDGEPRGEHDGGATGGGPTPVADWPFDEGSGLSVRDVSGRNHHGIATGGQWSADRDGAGGSAFTLVSGSDHIDVGAHPDFDRPAGAQITMVAWARVDSGPSHGYIVEVGFGSEGYGLELRNRTTLTYWDGINHAVEATVPDVVGSWHHYGVVIDGSRARLYLDGVRVAEGDADTTPRTATEVVFGVDAVEPVYLRGALDKARFYRAALTDAEILAEMNR